MQEMMKKMKGGGMMKMMKRMGGMKGMPKCLFRLASILRYFRGRTKPEKWASSRFNPSK